MIRIKVCGLCDLQNAAEVAAAGPDFMGFIFYPGSKRFVGNDPEEELFRNIPGIQKVGVFVNEKEEIVIHTARRFALGWVQLHGSESVPYCAAIRKKGLKVIKAAGVDGDFDFSSLDAFLPACDYFLFDSRTADYGGSGKKFNWEKIKAYTGDKPFFLSGGIGPGDVSAIRELNHSLLFAVDINSNFEILPGIKDILAVKNFVENLKFEGYEL
jgi:phosphoribosylanthranilate isomerase